MSASQKEILLHLVQGSEGREWAERRLGWNDASPEPVCQWDGIACGDDNNTVVSIQVPEADFLGTLPKEWGRLSLLERLDLRQNLIWGELPTEIARLPNLVTLNLKENQIKGPLPSFASTKLERLDLSHNDLSGTIPPDFGETNKALTFVDIQVNKLTGFLPYGLEDLRHLRTISISNNRLSGTLPQYLGNMEALEYLYLNHNYLVGSIPSDWKMINRTSSTLKEIWFQSNMLSGSIPSALSEAKYSLNDLYLDGNKLTGRVPTELCVETLNADFFTALPPGSDRDFCDSVSCPAKTVSEYGVYPCTDCSSSTNNPYLGRRGNCEDLTESSILALLVSQSDTVDVLDSACTYGGVTCNSDNRVESIRFGGRGLKGTIPDELGFLEYLTELDLSDNELTGYLPSGLRFAPLTKLDVSGNKLRGILPPLLCLKDGINGNGANGEFSCTNLACPIGSYSNGTGYGDCQLCPDGAEYLASKYCRPFLDTGDDNPTVQYWGNPGFFLSAFFAASALAAACAGFYVVRRHRIKRKWSKGEYAHRLPSGRSSFPHVEEVKMRLQKLRERKESKGRGNWLQNRFRQSYHYIISLAETEAVREPPGTPKKNVTEGEIDDYGWKERASILAHRDLETTVEFQKKQGSGIGVWEYPDPLECAQSYSGSSHQNSSYDEDDDEQSLTSWLRNQDTSEENNRDVWLDVPRP